MDVCCECCVLAGRGLCDGLITRPEESYRLWCVVVCDQGTSSRMRSPRSTLGCSAIKKIIVLCDHRCICDPMLTETSLCGRYLYQYVFCSKFYWVVKIPKDEMGRPRSTLSSHMHTTFGEGNLKERDHVEHPNIYRKIILK